MTLSYDEVKRPIAISLGTAGSLSQTFDRAGRVAAEGRSLTGIAGDAGTGSQSFTYDGLSRLTGSSLASAARSYQYDLDGNRTSKVEAGITTGYTYDRGDQVLLEAGGSARGFAAGFGVCIWGRDSRGRMRSGGGYVGGQAGEYAADMFFDIIVGPKTYVMDTGIR